MSESEQPDSAPEREEDRDALAEHRRYLRDSHQTASRDFDRALLAMASGAIGISLAFLDRIAPDPVHTWLVLLAWIGLVASLATNLLSHMTSQRAMEQDIDYLDSGDLAAAGEDSWTPLLNRVSAVAFVVGVLLLVLFTYQNLGHGEEPDIKDRGHPAYAKD